MGDVNARATNSCEDVGLKSLLFVFEANITEHLTKSREGKGWGRGGLAHLAYEYLVSTIF